MSDSEATDSQEVGTVSGSSKMSDLGRIWFKADSGSVCYWNRDTLEWTPHFSNLPGELPQIPSTSVRPHPLNGTYYLEKRVEETTPQETSTREEVISPNDDDPI